MVLWMHVPMLTLVALSATHRSAARGRPGSIRATAVAAEASDVATKTISVTILSGFLGAGKTTLLQHLLANKQGLRIGAVVNDMGAVNIDAKLVTRSGDNDAESTESDFVELSNGCVCCSAGEDLLGALAELVSVSFMRGKEYDHIVVECSGVAEPRLVRSLFQDAQGAGWPLMRYLTLDNMVSVVDAGGFMELYGSAARMEERPELGECDPEPSPWAGDDVGSAARRAVSQLLVEQVEVADVLLLNKADRLDAPGMARLRQLLGAINGFAELFPCEYGQVAPEHILVPQREGGVALSNEVMDHKSAVDMALWLRSRPAEAPAEAPADEHAHADAHEHSHAGGDAEAECADPSHDHSHAHAHADAHEHSHAGGDAEAECADPAVCTDPTHDHSHAHGHEHSHADGGLGGTTAARRFGINSFVYSRRRPFAPERLRALLVGLPLLTAAALPGAPLKHDGAAGGDGPFAPVLRSKGFVWVGSEASVAYYWSHAGRHLELNELGRWWAAVPRAEWPEAHHASILEDFDPAGGEGGDRRQELVFIGAGLDEAAISAALDACLLTDAEMEELTLG